MCTDSRQKACKLREKGDSSYKSSAKLALLTSFFFGFWFCGTCFVFVKSLTSYSLWKFVDFVRKFEHSLPSLIFRHQNVRENLLYGEYPGAMVEFSSIWNQCQKIFRKLLLQFMAVADDSLCSDYNHNWASVWWHTMPK